MHSGAELRFNQLAMAELARQNFLVARARAPRRRMAELRLVEEKAAEALASRWMTQRRTTHGTVLWTALKTHAKLGEKRKFWLAGYSGGWSSRG